MDLVLPIAIGLVVLASFVVAYFSFRTWKLYNVLLVLGVLLAGLGYWFLSARVVKTHDAWRKLIRQKSIELDSKELEHRQLREGVLVEELVVTEGLRHLRSRMHLVSLDRGEAWRAVQPARPAADGTVEVTVEKPEPHGLTEGLVLFAFEEKPVVEGGQYVGEFRVAAANPAAKSATLAPSLPFSPRQVQRLAASAGPWSLYLKMPTDNQRDYELYFHESQKDAFLLGDAAAKLARYVADVEAEVQITEAAVKQRQQEQADLQHDFEKFKQEAQAVAQYRSQLQTQYDAVHADVQRLSAENQRLAARLTSLQLQLAEEINRRTEAESARAQAATPEGT